MKIAALGAFRWHWGPSGPEKLQMFRRVVNPSRMIKGVGENCLSKTDLPSRSWSAESEYPGGQAIIIHRIIFSLLIRASINKKKSKLKSDKVL